MIGKRNGTLMALSFAALMASGKAGGIPLATLSPKKQRQIHSRNVSHRQEKDRSKPPEGNKAAQRRLRQMARAAQKAGQ